MAISQRQTSGFFEHLLKEDEVEEIKTAIRNFFEEKAQCGRLRDHLEAKS